MSDKDDEMARLARRDPEYSHIPDDTLDDWYRRWPSTLPTSVPHEQVRMLVENVRVARARIADLEAQVRERDEALKVAGESLRWLVNVVCGVGKSGDYPSISEDGAAVDAAKSALANPLIGGAR